MIDFYIAGQGIYKDTYDRYYDEVKKIIWSSFASAITDVSLYLEKFTDELISEFSSRSYEISSLDIKNSIFKNPEFESLSFEVIHDAVNSVYNYFVEIKLIDTV